MLHEPWFLEAEKQTEIRIHRLRILFHIASTILVILARCLIGPLVKPIFIWVMASFPFLAAADLMILFVPRKRGHLFGWVKYAVSVMDLFYVTVMVFTVRTMLGENYYRMHYQVPAFAIFHVLIILSGFRFRRRITILNGLAVITVVSLIALMDLKDGGGQDPVWTFSYATIILS